MSEPIAHAPSDESSPSWWDNDPSAVVTILATTTNGLATADAEQRHRVYGSNLLTPAKEEPWYEELVEELTEPLVLLLLAVGVLYAIFGEARDAAIIIVVIAITIVAEFFTEMRAKRAVDALAELRAPHATVRRDGKSRNIPVENIVPGDIVLLDAGASVPADIRLLSSDALATDESALTGESTAAEKRADAIVSPSAALADRPTMLYAGTTVVRGRGEGVVVAIGDHTELAGIANLVGNGHTETDLQRELRRLSGVFIWIALGASILVPILLVSFGTQSWRDALLTGLTMAFATIPEELPILVTTVLALGSWRLAKRNAVVKSLHASEALGAVSILVSDKTGTLTENRMTVTAIVDARGQRHDIRADDALVRRAIEIGLLANDATSADRGDPTDLAFYTAFTKLGFAPNETRGCVADLRPFPFSDATRSVAARYRQDGLNRVAVKGAPESVLRHCTSAFNGDSVSALSPDDRRRILDLANTLAEGGFRVLATADRSAALPPDTPRDEVETDLTFVGFVLLQDPVRQGAKSAVHDLAVAGVRTVMITGDHPATAAAIGREIGLPVNAPIVGAELPDEGRSLGDAALQHRIIARATPEEKHRLVTALEEAGERIAVTGDGINDAPALARASVGVAMGKGGTDVARAAADLILADDNIVTVVGAVREARHLYDNLRKVIRFYLAVKVALILIMVLPAMLGSPIPFTPVQIILLELLMDLGASVSFVSEPPEADVMQRPPHDPRHHFLDRAMGGMILLGGVVLTLAVLGMYGWVHQTGMDAGEARTAAFATWLIAHVALALTFRSEREPLLHLGIFSNSVALIWMGAAIGLAVLTTTFGPIQTALRTTSLSPEIWLGILLVSIATCILMEAIKTAQWRKSSPLVPATPI